MTIEQVIGQVDTLKPNSYSDEEKRIWLKRLEQRIILEIVNTHEPEPPKNNFGDAYCDGEINEEDIALIKVFAGKNAVPTEKEFTASDVDGDGKITVVDANLVRKYISGELDEFPVGRTDVGHLTAPAPYDEVYLRWLEAQIDYANGEIERYNNSITAFNHAYSAFERYYNRTHLPIRKKMKYF